jgi:hypothetical protein
LSVDQWNAERAGNEIQIARENADLAAAGGLAQSQQLYGAATVAEASGITSAIGKIGMAYAMYNQSATPAETKAVTPYGRPVTTDLPPMSQPVSLYGR